MDNQRGLTIVLWIVVLFGIFFLARGLTGKAIMDVTTSDQCISDNSCAEGKICCNGFCNTPEICSQITNSTLEKPGTEKNYLVDIGLGLLVLLAVLIAFYGINRKSKRENVSRKVIRKRTRKKRI